MIACKVQDQFDGSNKVNDLKGVVGETYADNFSSTGRSVLVAYNEDTGKCVTKEVASPYKSGNKNPKPGTKSQPDWLVWNGFFF